MTLQQFRFIKYVFLVACLLGIGITETHKAMEKTEHVHSYIRYDYQEGAYGCTEYKLKCTECQVVENIWVNAPYKDIENE